MRASLLFLVLFYIPKMYYVSDLNLHHMNVYQYKHIQYIYKVRLNNTLLIAKGKLEIIKLLELRKRLLKCIFSPHAKPNTHEIIMLANY